MSVLLALLLCASPSSARPPEPPTRAELDAEYRRLSAEIASATQKGNWKGVERSYLAALATGAVMVPADHLRAAEAARSRGDLGQVRDRLLAALAVDPTHEEARIAVADLDARFGRVDLKAPIGATLEDYEHPFDPVAIKAVEHGIATLKATGAFRGLLPPGPYSVDGDPFDVVLGKEVVLDLGGGVAIPLDPNVSSLAR